mgnify:CR=1 FL=1
MIKFAQFVSVLGHPLFMPCYAFGLLTLTNPYIHIMIGDSVKQIVFIILAIFTVVLPIISVIILKQLRLITSIHLNDARERTWPFIFTLLWYYMGFQLLSKLYIPESFLAFYYNYSKNQRPMLSNWQSPFFSNIILLLANATMKN